MADDGLVELARRLQGRCIDRGLTAATAESCTGGRLADALTDVAGSSRYYRGGFIAYADETKRDVLGVPAETLAAHGAVSAQVARAMAAGARHALGTDVGVAVTGIAGPDGGTAEKPVGLTYVAVALGDDVDVRRFQWTGDREANKRSSVAAALDLLIERLGA